MPAVNAANLAALRDQFQWSKFYLGVLKPATVHTSQINYPAMPRGTLAIPFDGGAYATGFTVANIRAGITLWVGTTANSHDICKLRIRTPYNRTCTAGSAYATADGGITGTITVCEHNYLLLDNYYLTIKEEFRLWPKHMTSTGGLLNTVWYMDYDIQYCGQNKDASRQPIVRMGPPAVAIRDAAGNATINFWSNSGAAPGGSAPAAYAWTWRGGNPPTAATAGTAASPHAVTWTVPGFYLATLTLDGVVSGYRPVFIYDSISQKPYESFEVQNLSGDYNTGGWRMSVRVKQECAEADFPEESMIILWAEDWYKGSKVSLGGNYRHRENNIFVGYITKESVRKDPFTDDVLFEAHTIDGEMKNCEEFALSLDDDPNANTEWPMIQNMTMDKIAYHVVKWHSTLLDITDVHFSDDPKLVRWADITQKSLYDQIDKDCYDAAILGRCLSDRMGIIQCEKNPQFIASAVLRNLIPTIMDIQAQDWRDGIELPSPQTPICSLVDLSGVSYAGSLVDTAPIFSLAHGDVMMERGRMVEKSNLVLSTQVYANQVAGNYLANQNNPYPDVRVPIGLNYRVFDIAPQEWVTMSLAAADTFRGVTWTSERFIPRTVGFNLENVIGALNIDLGLEMETSGTAGVPGNYPVTPPEPEPYVPPPPPVPPPYPPPIVGEGKVVYVATDKGMARCADATLGAGAVWTAINTGLGADLAVLAFRFDPSWQSPNKRGTCNTRTAIYTGAHLDGVGGTPTWTQKLTIAQARTLCGAAAIDGFVGPRTWNVGGKYAGFIIGPTMFEANYIGVFAYDDYDPPDNVKHWYLHSHDWGATWTCSALDADVARMIVPLYSLHIYNRIHVMHFYKQNHGDDNGAYEYSNDGGHTWSIVNGVAGIGFPGDVYMRDWIIPYKKSTGALNTDEKENWVARQNGGNSVSRSTTAITSGHAAIGPAGVLYGNRLAYSTHNPQDWVLMECSAAGHTPKMYLTTNWAASWTEKWSADDTYYPTVLAGFPYNGDYFYWGAYRGMADPAPIYLWYTRNAFATTTSFRGNLDAILGLAAGDKIYELVPDWTV